MIARDKLFIVAENIDDSLQAQITAYELKIFRTFTELESYINRVPVVLETLVISQRVLPFTGQNMQRVINLTESPFLRLTGNVVYLINKDVDYDVVNNFLDDRQINNWAVYQGDLSVKFITDIVMGNGRQAQESVNEIVTYRMRASDYVKQQNQLKYEDNTAKYLTDDDLLQGIPDVEEPEEIMPVSEHSLKISYIVGEPSVERSLMVFLASQYLSMKQRVLILERDSEYHTLGEIVTKSSAKYTYIDVEEFLKDVSAALDKVRNAKYRLIFIGSKNRTKYDYNFLFEVLQSNLKDSLDYMIRECDFEDTPYGKYYTVVCQNNIPAILRCCNSIKYEINPEMVTFVGVQSSSLGALNLTSREMQGIIEILLSCNGIFTLVVQARGLVLKNEEVVYDILSIINRGNRG